MLVVTAILSMLSRYNVHVKPRYPYVSASEGIAFFDALSATGKNTFLLIFALIVIH